MNLPKNYKESIYKDHNLTSNEKEKYGRFTSINDFFNLIKEKNETLEEKINELEEEKEELDEKINELEIENEKLESENEKVIQELTNANEALERKFHE